MPFSFAFVDQDMNSPVKFNFSGGGGGRRFVEFYLAFVGQGFQQVDGAEGGSPNF